MKRFMRLLSVTTLLLGISQSVGAKVSEAEAAKLGKELTPVGAERAGNKEGTIPAWTPIKAFGNPKGEFPYNKEVEADKPIFTITAKDVTKYSAKLSEGHKELFKRFPDTYKMVVYPTRRVANFPEKVLAETVKNATRAELEGVDNPRGAFVGFPFPIPQTGAEPVWNHRAKWRGENIRRYNNQMIVQPDGKFSLTKIIEDVQFNYASVINPKPDEMKPDDKAMPKAA